MHGINLRHLTRKFHLKESFLRFKNTLAFLDGCSFIECQQLIIIVLWVEFQSECVIVERNHFLIPFPNQSEIEQYFNQ